MNQKILRDTPGWYGTSGRGVPSHVVKQLIVKHVQDIKCVNVVWHSILLFINLGCTMVGCKKMRLFNVLKVSSSTCLEWKLKLTNSWLVWKSFLALRNYWKILNHKWRKKNKLHRLFFYVWKKFLLVVEQWSDSVSMSCNELILKWEGSVLWKSSCVDGSPILKTVFFLAVNDEN